MPHCLSALVEQPADGARLVVAGRRVAATVECAFDSASRRRGLLGRDRLAADHALIIAPCNAVHTWFMRFPIDVLFVGRDGTLLKTARHVKPWRVVACLSAFAAVELGAGTLDRLGLTAGSQLMVESAE